MFYLILVALHPPWAIEKMKNPTNVILGTSDVMAGPPRFWPALLWCHSAFPSPYFRVRVAVVAMARQLAKEHTSFQCPSVRRPLGKTFRTFSGYRNLKYPPVEVQEGIEPSFITHLLYLLQQVIRLTRVIALPWPKLSLLPLYPVWSDCSHQLLKYWTILFGAVYGARTHNLVLGKHTIYQLI